MAVLVPLVLLIDAVGDTLVALLLFALLWISTFTLVVLFVPRLSAMFSKAEALDEHDSGARVVGGDGFSFLSLASFEAGSGAMGQYVAALELHLAQAKARHSQLKQGDSKGMEWMKATAGGRKQSVAEDSSIGRAQHQPEQRKAREKSIATATGYPKPSLSYMTQTYYNEAARSNAGSPTLGPTQVQRVKTTVAASGRAQLPSSHGSSIAATPAESVIAISNAVSLQSEVLDSRSPSGVQKAEARQQNEEKTEPAADVHDASVVSTPVEAAVVARPASVSRSRSIKVQPSFERAASSQAEKQLSELISTRVVAADAQPDDSSKPEELPAKQQPEEAKSAVPTASDSQYALPALPVADDMIVHDLSSRMARASIDGGKGSATDNAAALRSPTIMRQRANSSRGILMTPVTGGATLSSRGSGDTEPQLAAEEAQPNVEPQGDLDIETGEAMQDIE